MANECLSTVTINCGCGREICTVSLNIGGMRGTMKCECGQEYVFDGSLIPQNARSPQGDRQPICTIGSDNARA